MQQGVQMKRLHPLPLRTGGGRMATVPHCCNRRGGNVVCESAFIGVVELKLDQQASQSVRE